MSQTNMNVRVCARIGVLVLTCTRRKLVKAIDRAWLIGKVRNELKEEAASRLRSLLTTRRMAWKRIPCLATSALDGNARFVVSRTHT